MKPLSKVLLTLSLTILCLGAIACVMAFALSGGDISKLDIDNEYETKIYSVEKSVNSLKFDVDKHNITFKQSSSAQGITIEYSENEYDKFKATEKNSQILFTNKYAKNAFFRQFCLLFDRKNKSEENITVTLPKSFNGSIIIESADSNVEVESEMILSSLNINIKKGNVKLSGLTVDNAAIDVKTGIVDIINGSYKKLDITVSNAAVYVPIDEPTSDDDPTKDPTESTDSTVTPDVTDNPNPDNTPEVEDNSENTNTPDTTAEPDTSISLTPEEPTPTIKPTKTPTILSVTKSITFDNTYVDDINITVYNTNIDGKLARTANYYSIKTNNTESSNIATNENLTAKGSIIINQNGGSTEIIFK